VEEKKEKIKDTKKEKEETPKEVNLQEVREYMEVI
jgi:hypothetical protein